MLSSIFRGVQMKYECPDGSDFATSFARSWLYAGLCTLLDAWVVLLREAGNKENKD